MDWFKKLISSKKNYASKAPSVFGGLPEGITAENWRTFLEKPAAPLQVGGFRPSGDLTTTVFGDVRAGHKHEAWPMYNEKPLWPLCQLNLTEASYVPEGLQDLKLISIFVDSNIIPVAPDNIEANSHDGLKAMAIRTYTSLDKLELLNPCEHDSNLEAFECKWLPPQVDYPNHDCMPFDFDELGIGDFYDQDDVDGLQVTKLGGWPMTVQSEPWWDYIRNEQDFRYVLQIESEPKAYWGIGDGAMFFARSQKNPDLWALDIQFT